MNMNRCENMNRHETGGQVEQRHRCLQVDRQDRWADGTGGQTGTDGQMEWVDRQEQVDRQEYNEHEQMGKHGQM